MTLANPRRVRAPGGPMWSIMRLPGNLVARIAPMNLKVRKCLIINDHFLRFMGRIAASDPPVRPPQQHRPDGLKDEIREPDD
jgi:hypothetical protein